MGWWNARRVPCKGLSFQQMADVQVFICGTPVQVNGLYICKLGAPVIKLTNGQGDPQI
jgi:hypothetical protein